MCIFLIIDKEISHIEVKPQENTVTIEGGSGLFTVYRLDFLAVVKTPEGEKKVLIELQKAKFSTDIMRFRKYLGEQYKKDDLPIITIYFLGYSFDSELSSVIEVSRVYKDRLNDQKIIQKKNEFIESLTHDSIVIQIPKLKLKYKTRLEQILSVFEQTRLSDDKHILYYDYPLGDDLQKKITHRLNYAASDEQIKREIDMEEEILTELQTLERKIEAKEKVIEEKDKALEEKDRLIQELREKLKDK